MSKYFHNSPMRVKYYGNDDTGYGEGLGILKRAEFYIQNDN